MVSVYMSVIQPSMVRANLGLVALTIHPQLAYINSSSQIRKLFFKTVPYVILSSTKFMLSINQLINQSINQSINHVLQEAPM